MTIPIYGGRHLTTPVVECPEDFVVIEPDSTCAVCKNDERADLVCDAYDGWRTRRITLDGEDVGRFCRTVRLAGERPVALILYVRDTDGEHLIYNHGLLYEHRRGEITVEGLRRERVAA